MYQIIVSHESALKYLREKRINLDDSQYLSEINEILRNKKYTPDEKINILVDNINKVNKSERFKYHIRQAELPKKSLIQISKNIYYTCPELNIVHLAQKLCYEHLSLLVLELCGNYSINTSTREFFNTKDTATNILKLSEYVSKYKQLNPNAKGINKLENILNFASNNSASPMESRLYIKLCGPRKRGFYGCNNLRMNRPVKLSKKASLIAGQDIIIPDISCAKKKVAIEYDSKQFHENATQDQKDKRRRDALVLDGWKVHTILSSHINDINTFNIIAKKILKDLGQSNRIRVKNFNQIQYNSFQKLR